MCPSNGLSFGKDRVGIAIICVIDVKKACNVIPKLVSTCYTKCDIYGNIHFVGSLTFVCCNRSILKGIVVGKVSMDCILQNDVKNFIEFAYVDTLHCHRGDCIVHFGIFNRSNKVEYIADCISCRDSQRRACQTEIKHKFELFWWTLTKVDANCLGTDDSCTLGNDGNKCNSRGWEDLHSWYVLSTAITLRKNQQWQQKEWEKLIFFFFQFCFCSFGCCSYDDVLVAF